MIVTRPHGKQSGVITIFVAMILLILVTLLVTTAYSLSTMNLQAVGNVQVRDEAKAAAQKAIELTVPGDFWLVTNALPYDINVNGDPSTSYNVSVAAPSCVRATQVNIVSASSVTLPGFSATDAWNTIWELDATATDINSGTRVRLRQGVRILMTTTDKDLYCG